MMPHGDGVCGVVMMLTFVEGNVSSTGAQRLIAYGQHVGVVLQASREAQCCGQVVRQAWLSTRGGVCRFDRAVATHEQFRNLRQCDDPGAHLALGAERIGQRFATRGEDDPSA
jgi:hypothetical protein